MSPPLSFDPPLHVSDFVNNTVDVHGRNSGFDKIEQNGNKRVNQRLRCPQILAIKQSRYEPA